MDIKPALDLLRDAESSLARLAGHAAAGQDYAATERLVAAARGIRALADQLSTGNPAIVPPASAAGASDGSPEGAEDSNSSDDEPAFSRDGDDLVKTGRSRAGQTYEHKAPRAALDLLLQRLLVTADKKGEFRTGRLFPLTDPSGRKLPSYQAYLTLRWLRHLGLVQRVGRQRYQLASGIDLVQSVESAWESLRSDEAGRGSGNSSKG